MPLSGLKVGFIGGGAMAGALLTGLVNSEKVSPVNLYVSDVNQERLDFLRDSLKVNTLTDNREIVSLSDVVIFALKPGVVFSVIKGIEQEITAEKTMISIVAGVSCASLEAVLGVNASVVRVMPNTPALVGAGASAISLGLRASGRDADRALAIFNAVGSAVQVPETMMDAVTGLSGSGPAYMFVILEALADAGVRMGLPRDIASVLSAQTMLGSAKMMLESGQHPGQLKDMVTTPGGTTIQGLFELENAALRASLMKAVEAATKKSGELTAGLIK
ncbi:MAG: pyrroline-5-carboxylate reductase [Peptococcaceae bacterium]|nr:pyrroline-5-carboxylate reductase [Peptococcaceae bacterium]